ncbi:dienelactone hydrolase family protein [Tengunoibacter tsumagoiensis]|uniref:Carboxymethylenebutenolidase n=1 Tax=Tengunoibacter tsumagoiensis TaxID=2014871 RepID=A0A402A016_9CHLR|nr:dienelactone hydrolase family protein [Tengunoibacter tsumagoiensis]GCE12371.1 carboxymethylenebutenolidase [Tengunoibacter tsumagoiensis]
MVQTYSVSFPSPVRQLEGYLARPEGDGPFPAVVVIHEIFGLTDNIRDIAVRFANEGYVALAVDLFAGRNRTVCMFRAMGQMLFSPLDNEGINDLKLSLSYLAEQAGVASERIGAIGFCMGGGFAISWACTDNRLKAIAPFYGANPKPLEAVSRLCPVVGSYPDKDFTTPAAKKLDQALTTYNIPHDIKIYPDTKHSFFNDQGKTYNANAASDSWQRVLSFFSEHIG